jgi:hypothetical protein
MVGNDPGFHNKYFGKSKAGRIIARLDLKTGPRCNRSTKVVGVHQEPHASVAIVGKWSLVIMVSISLSFPYIVTIVKS